MRSPSPEEHPNPSALFGEERDRPVEGEGDQWDGWMDVRILDYKKELEGGKESYVSFGVETKVSPRRISRGGGGTGGPVGDGGDGPELAPKGLADRTSWITDSVAVARLTTLVRWAKLRWRTRGWTSLCDVVNLGRIELTSDPSR